MIRFEVRLRQQLGDLSYDGRRIGWTEHVTITGTHAQTRSRQLTTIWAHDMICNHAARR
jgi:hypothetical protein